MMSYQLSEDNSFFISLCNCTRAITNAITKMIGIILKCNRIRIISMIKRNIPQPITGKRNSFLKAFMRHFFCSSSISFNFML